MTIGDLLRKLRPPQLSQSPVHHYRCMARERELPKKPLTAVASASLVTFLVAMLGAVSPTDTLGNPESEAGVENASPLGMAISTNFREDWLKRSMLDADSLVNPPIAATAGIDPVLLRRFLSSRLHRLDKLEPRSRSDHRLILEGLKSFSEGAYLDAGVKFKRASKENANNPTAHLGLALSLSKLGYHDRAFDALLAALKKDTNDVVTLYYGAQLLNAAGNARRSEQLLSRALRAPEVREWRVEDAQAISQMEKITHSSVSTPPPAATIAR